VSATTGPIDPPNLKPVPAAATGGRPRLV